MGPDAPGSGRTVLRQVARPPRKADTWRSTWDAEDHLVEVVTPDGARWRYLHDPLGRRTVEQRLGGAAAGRSRNGLDRRPRRHQPPGRPGVDDTGTILIREGDHGTFMQPSRGVDHYRDRINE